MTNNTPELKPCPEFDKWWEAEEYWPDLKGGCRKAFIAGMNTRISLIEPKTLQDADKCQDCGSPMMEVCSGLEKISREGCQPVIDDWALAEAVEVYQQCDFVTVGEPDYCPPLEFIKRYVPALITHALKSQEKVVEVTEIEFVRAIDGLDSYASAAELFEHLEMRGFKIIKSTNNSDEVKS